MPIARLNSYENKVLSTNDISSIKRVLIRKFVKFPIVVVQQQRQRSKRKNVMQVQSCFFANEAFRFFYKYSSTCSVLSFVSKRDNILHAFILTLHALTFLC